MFQMPNARMKVCTATASQHSRATAPTAVAATCGARDSPRDRADAEPARSKASVNRLRKVMIRPPSGMNTEAATSDGVSQNGTAATLMGISVRTIRTSGTISSMTQLSSSDAGPHWPTAVGAAASARRVPGGSCTPVPGGGAVGREGASRAKNSGSVARGLSLTGLLTALTSPQRQQGSSFALAGAAGSWGKRSLPGDLGGPVPGVRFGGGAVAQQYIQVVGVRPLRLAGEVLLQQRPDVV